MSSTAVVKGVVSGLTGAVVMSVAEKAEQRLTGRPDSYVPGRTLSTLLGRPLPETAQPLARNLLMHYGTAAALGALRGLWSEIGLRGPVWTAAHAVVRLSTDQTLENATGVGAPPQSWPAREHAVDLLHKAIYAGVTGLLSDALVPARVRPLPGRHSH